MANNVWNRGLLHFILLFHVFYAYTDAIHIVNSFVIWHRLCASCSKHSEFSSWITHCFYCIFTEKLEFWFLVFYINFSLQNIRNLFPPTVQNSWNSDTTADFELLINLVFVLDCGRRNKDRENEHLGYLKFRIESWKQGFFSEDLAALDFKRGTVKIAD